MTKPQEIIKTILDSDLCVGCGLCEGVSNGAVKMELNTEGFLRPSGIIQNDEAAQQIVNSCPGYKLELPPSSLKCDPIWGPIIESRTGHAANEELRYLGSSGGGLSALIASLLANGFADNVLHITMDDDRPIGNRIVSSMDSASIAMAAGSRYSPSAPLAAIPSALTSNKRTILVGKPCDIAGARQFVEHNPEYNEQIVLMIAFMCGGMPSIKGGQEILSHFHMQEDDLISFRYRGKGWPGNVEAVTKNGQIEKMSYDQSWGDILRNHTQFRCKICPDAIGLFADIVFADAWHINEHNMPSFHEEEGRSMIVTRTSVGEKAYKIASDAKDLVSDDLTIDMMNKMQPYHVKRRKLALSRMLALKVTGQMPPSYKNLMVTQAALRAGVWGNVRSFLGTLRRIYLKKK